MREAPVTARPWSGYCAINSEQHAGTMAHILLLLLPLYFVFSHCLVVSLKADQGNYRWEPGTKIQFTDTALEKKSWPTQSQFEIQTLVAVSLTVTRCVSVLFIQYISKVPHIHICLFLLTLSLVVFDELLHIV